MTREEQMTHRAIQQLPKQVERMAKAVEKQNKLLEGMLKLQARWAFDPDGAVVFMRKWTGDE